MDNLSHLNNKLNKYSFLITGGAGFIGSNLANYLVQNGAGFVRVLDNLSTGDIENLSSIMESPNFEFIKGDIRDQSICKQVVIGINFIVHNAALGSVQRSIDDPLKMNEINITGFLNILHAAKHSNDLIRLVYASSSSVYGDSTILPKREDLRGQNLLSSYAVSKYTNELYAGVFSINYGFHSIGLRYFNVFGLNQKLDDLYGAVIPKFIHSAKCNKSPIIYGDGKNTRDFTYIENVIQANLLALFNITINKHEIFNIAAGQQTSIHELWNMIQFEYGVNIEPIFLENRMGDIAHSLADITKAKLQLGYEPKVRIEEGLRKLLKLNSDKILIK